MERLIQKLEPPTEVKYKIKELDKNKLPSNPILRFIKIFFFGEGF